MKNNRIIFLITLFFINIYYINNYVIFELNTFKNISNEEEEYTNFFYDNYKNIIYTFGDGDWGLGIGIGDWAQSPIPNPNPQSPIPNPHDSNIVSSYI